MASTTLLSLLSATATNRFAKAAVVTTAKFESPTFRLCAYSMYGGSSSRMMASGSP